jgi:hypothetical protein
MPENPASEEIDLSAALGADGGVSSECFTVYIPNKDKHGNEIGNQRQWVLDARQLLTEINRGASVMPPIEGGWTSDDEIVIWENPVVVYSFVRIEQFVANLPELREFLHRMGRETNQGEVVFEFADRFYRIRTFDAEKRIVP